MTSPALGTMVGGRYRLKIVQPGRSIQPPSEISRSLISIGSPGAQVICSTAALASSHVARLDRLAVGTDDGREARIDARRWPQLARRREDVAVLRHVGVEVFELDGFG